MLAKCYAHNDHSLSEKVMAMESRQMNNLAMDVHLQRQSEHPRMLNHEEHQARINRGLNIRDEECGSYTVAFAIDTSASIFMPLFGGKEDNIYKIKHALKDCITSLTDTLVQVALYSFSSHAKQETDGYVDMRKPSTVVLLHDIIGEGQNWNGKGSGIRFSENSGEMLTNWEDILLKVRETSRPPRHRPDFLILITDGDPNYRNDPDDETETDMSSAIKEVHRLLYGSENKTKIIPVGITHGVSEESLRAVTGLNNPQIGQDYFLSLDFEGLNHILKSSTLSETCCEHHRDKCGVCHGDGSSCGQPRFRIWTKIFKDLQDYEIYDGESDWFVDKELVYVKTHWDLADKHVHYDHDAYKVVIERVSICSARDGEMLPYEHEYSYRTGCQSYGVSIDVCTLYDAKKPDSKCFNTQNDITWHKDKHLDLKEIFGFYWVQEDKKDAFVFKGRALSKYRQIIQIYWKIVYNPSYHLEKLSDKDGTVSHQFMGEFFTDSLKQKNTIEAVNAIQQQEEVGILSKPPITPKMSHYDRHCQFFSVKCPRHGQYFSYEQWECVSEKSPHEEHVHKKVVVRFVFVMILTTLFSILAICIYAMVLNYHHNSKCVYQYPKQVTRNIHQKPYSGVRVRKRRDFHNKEPGIYEHQTNGYDISIERDGVNVESSDVFETPKRELGILNFLPPSLDEEDMDDEKKRD